MSYQWQKSDSDDGEYSVIEGETNKDFTPDTSAAGTTYYKCVVTNTLDGKTASADSAIFTVTVVEEGEVMPPKVVSETTEYTVEVGNEVILEVTAESLDDGTLSYQWQKSDSADGEYSVIEGETNKDFTPDTSAVGTTYYKCVVTNTLDGKTASADGAVFTVEVIEKKGVEDKEATRPKVEAITEYTVEVNKEETLAVTAESLDGGKLSYKWSKSSDKETFEELADETTASLVIKPTENGTFYYKCEVTNSVELDGETKTATSDVVITVTVVDGKGNINIDFN